MISNIFGFVSNGVMVRYPLVASDWRSVIERLSLPVAVDDADLPTAVLYPQLAEDEVIHYSDGTPNLVKPAAAIWKTAWAIVPVVDTPQPAHTTIQSVLELAPVFAGGVWNRAWQVVDLSPAEAAAVQAAEANATVQAGILTALAADPRYTALKNASNAQIDTWLVDNITTLPLARDLFGTILKILRNKVL